MEDIRSVGGGENADLLSSVRIRCHDGRVVECTGPRKTCVRLIEQIQMRLGDGGSEEACRRRAFREVSDPLQRVLAEWLMCYGAGVFLLGFHGFLLYRFCGLYVFLRFIRLFCAAHTSFSVFFFQNCSFI